MTGELQNSKPTQEELPARITAIVPARNEASVIAACVESLAAQPEIEEIIVVDDQSTDATAKIVRNLIPKIPRLKLVECGEIPAGWVGKNHAVCVGANLAKGPWLLFTDADAELQAGAAAAALQLAKEKGAAMLSLSPEQITEKWYEKALIPFMYVRLAKRFSYETVNDPASPIAAANGQFLLVQREAYQSFGGHSAVAGEVLEDVALAWLAKSQGIRLWFAPGKGFVRVRMYRSFQAMWQGWKKNAYLLVGANPNGVYRELESTIPWIPLLLILGGLKFPLLFFLGVCFLLVREFIYGMELRSNQFPGRLIIYYVPGVALYASVLWASYRGYTKGKIQWKGRQVPVSLPGAPR